MQEFPQSFGCITGKKHGLCVYTKFPNCVLCSKIQTNKLAKRLKTHTLAQTHKHKYYP